jgi:hypothetical protein
VSEYCCFFFFFWHFYMFILQRFSKITMHCTYYISFCKNLFNSNNYLYLIIVKEKTFIHLTASLVGTENIKGTLKINEITEPTTYLSTTTK